MENIRCCNCNSDNIVIISLQDRELFTELITFIHCVVCNHQWDLIEPSV